MTGGKGTKNLRCYDSGDDAHNSVTANGNPVARAAVGGGQDLGCIGVEGAVVDVLPIIVSTTNAHITHGPTLPEKEPE